MKKIILGGSRVGKTGESPLMEMIMKFNLEQAKAGVRRVMPEWIEDDLHPVHFGPYTIIGHNIDIDGTHHLYIRDTIENIDIHLTGKEEKHGIHDNHSSI